MAVIGFVRQLTNPGIVTDGLQREIQQSHPALACNRNNIQKGKVRLSGDLTGNISDIRLQSAPTKPSQASTL